MAQYMDSMWTRPTVQMEAVTQEKLARDSVLPEPVLEDLEQEQALLSPTPPTRPSMPAVRLVQQDDPPVALDILDEWIIED